MPAGKPGLFKVFYQGKPLAKAKAELIAESGWKREFKTDEQGAFEATLPWRGAYVIEVPHTDATPAGGEGAGAYDRKRFVVRSLSFKVHARHGLDRHGSPALVDPRRADDSE